MGAPVYPASAQPERVHTGRMCSRVLDVHHASRQQRRPPPPRRRVSPMACRRRPSRREAGLNRVGPVAATIALATLAALWLRSEPAFFIASDGGARGCSAIVEARDQCTQAYLIERSAGGNILGRPSKGALDDSPTRLAGLFKGVQRGAVRRYSCGRRTGAKSCRRRLPNLV